MLNRSIIDLFKIHFLFSKYFSGLLCEYLLRYADWQKVVIYDVANKTSTKIQIHGYCGTKKYVFSQMPRSLEFLSVIFQKIIKMFNRSYSQY